MNNRRGSVLVATMGFVLVFTMLGLSAIYLGTVQNEAAEKRIASMKAFWLAEAGLEKARWEIDPDGNDCKGLKRKENFQTCSSCLDCSGEEKFLADTIAGYGGYDVEINSMNTVVTSTGSFETSGHPLFAQRKVRFGWPLFTHALFADEYLELEGNMKVDSYDSAVGPYDPNAADRNGRIGSNGAGTPSNPIISLSGGVDIVGDVSTGGDGVGYVSYGGPVQSLNVKAGSNPHISCKGDPSPCENIDTHVNNVPLPPVVVPSSLKNLSDYSTPITDNATLETGDYKYTSMNIIQNKTLTIDGQVNIYLTSTSDALTLGHGAKLALTPGSSVVIYMDGRLKLYQNSEVNNHKDDKGQADGRGRPADVQILSTYTPNGLNSSAGVFMQNNGAFYGTIYAPQTNIKIENNQGVYGAVVGEEIIVDNNASFYYDKSLFGDFSSSGKWQEL